MVEKRKSRGEDIAENEGRGRSIKWPDMKNTCRERVFGGDAEFSTARSGLEGKALRNLGADMLGTVFSYLPQKELFEVLLVSKHWGKTVIEGGGLWKKVCVCRKWDVGGEGRDMRENEILRRVIGLAEEVTFSKGFRGKEKHVMSVGGWLAPNLRILKLPSESVPPTFFLTLVSKCPLLESLEVEDPKALRNDPVHIRHPNLKSLTFSSHLSLVVAVNRPLVVSIDCPALTHLSTIGELRGVGKRDWNAAYAPSLFFPKLKSLCFSSLQSTKFVEAVAAHAPNITSLEVKVTDEIPFIALTRFKALQALRIWNSGREGFPSNAFTSWPLLESLRLDLGVDAKEIEVAHVGLKSLEIYAIIGPMSPTLSCISLEHLQLFCNVLESKCLKNLDQSCPKLKRVDLTRFLSHSVMDEFGDADEADGPLEIVHEKVEELVLGNFSRSSIRVACTNLKKLVMRWVHPVSPTVSATLRLPTLECPKLRCLKLCSYDHMFRSIPAMLSVLPELESLTCDCAREDVEDVVLEHQNLRNIVVAMTQIDGCPAESELKLKRLTLVMPSLVEVEVVETIRVLVVKEREEVVVKYQLLVNVEMASVIGSREA